MAFKVPEEYRIISGFMKSDLSFGCNGFFSFKKNGITFFVMATDGLGWEHVSVSLSVKRAPDWEEMCMIKDLFWDDEDTVIQFHPKKSEYINNHEYVLHLWKKVDFDYELPPRIFV